MTGQCMADSAFDRCLGTIRALERDLKLTDRLQQWDKDGHLTRMKASGCFRYAREALLHHCDLGNADRLLGLVLSQVSTMDLLKAGLSEEQLGIGDLRHIAVRTLEPGKGPGSGARGPEWASSKGLKMAL
jgi:hypothetical protein